jgi:DNA adenine methylase
MHGRSSHVYAAHRNRDAAYTAGEEGMTDRRTQLEIFPQEAASEPLPPLFRWPGGKRWLVPRLLPLLPEEYGRYFEPFFGGGALYFAARPRSAVLSDANVELMNCYDAVRRDYRRVAQLLQALPTDEASYYRVRATEPTDPFERAARTIYLTAHAFNGIYRVNLRGKFNVPYGGRPYPNLGAEELLAPYSSALQGARITSGDFAAILESAVAGDLIYLDPPYTVMHENNGFVKYNDRIFQWRDQERLAALAHDLKVRGCHVIASSAYHESVRDLYEGFEVVVVGRASVMAADSSRRGATREFVFTTLPTRGL